MTLRCHAYWDGTAGTAAQAAKLHIRPTIHANRIDIINAWWIMAEKRKLFRFILAARQTGTTIRHALDLRGFAVDVRLATVGC
jgi:hypothetical protein